MGVAESEECANKLHENSPLFLAQRGGFEPPEHFCSPVFETGTFDHSDISASEFIITLSAKIVKCKFVSYEKYLTNKVSLTIIILLNKKEDFMSRTNRIICYVVAMIMLLCVAVLMFGCKNTKDDQTTVMNMSINPEVEFILDKNNKVVSVSAKNDEGNFIIAKASFEGLSAEEAAKFFVKISNENGFIAQVGDLKIEISGDKAQELFNNVKANVEIYIDQEGLNISIDFEKISREELENLLESCMKELSDEQIKALKNDEIIAKLKEMRDQTKDLNTQKLKDMYKDMYYEFRAQAIEKAQFDAYIEAIKASTIFNKDQIIAYYNELTQKIAAMQKEFVDEFMAVSSDYQQKMQEFIIAKQELLQARIDGATEEILRQKEQALKLVETHLDAAERAAELAIGKARATFETVKTTLKAALDAVMKSLPDSINGSIKIETDKVKVEFSVKFKSDYAEYIKADYWDGLAVNVA